MQDFALYILFSMLETFAMFFLAFRVFKIDLYTKEIVFASALMAFISYTLRYDYGLITADIIVQYILNYLFLWLLFRIQFFYAAIVNGLAYLSYMLIQSTCYLIMDLTGANSLVFPFMTLSVYMLQSVSALVTLIAACYIHRKRKGFDFIPDKPDERITLSLREVILFAISAPSVLIVILTIILTNNEYSRFFFLMPLAYGMLLYSYTYYAYKKDMNNHELFSE
ncbi:hypothetical protein [Paenibacillus tengchongensis]|uniref:hypothetical protein n=1 Tax=Paenibacillus tengchongensis TaxID=2608684 RepID=UPI00124E5CE3|nr:hypothetical protein [Paenibacillus tengchongensis]